MQTIKKIRLSRMTQQQAFEFYERICSSIEGVIPEFKPYCDQLKKATKEFGDTLAYYRSSRLTKKIQYYDQQRTSDWRSLRLSVNSLLHSAPEEYSEIVEEIDLILKTYGNPANVPNTAQSGIIKNLVDDLLTRIDEDNRKDLGINKIINDLQENNNMYVSHLRNRQYERKAHIPGSSRVKRAELEKAYRNMTKALEVYADQHKENSDLQIFIADINKLIEEEKALLKSHLTRLQNKSDSPEEPGSQKE